MIDNDNYSLTKKFNRKTFTFAYVTANKNSARKRKNYFDNLNYATKISKQLMNGKTFWTVWKL